MPLGIQQNNNLLHLTMDVWQDQIFFNETVYPAGHFAAELLNVPKESMRELVTHGGTISHQVEALALSGRGEFIKLLDETRVSLENLLDALWHCPPYSLTDKGDHWRNHRSIRHHYSQGTADTHPLRYLPGGEPFGHPFTLASTAAPAPLSPAPNTTILIMY